MTGLSGGVAAAFGFRYQYLVTVEILLDLFTNATTEDWAVDVDRADQDSADIIVHTSLNAGPTRAIQVKASMPESSTTIGTKRVRDILATIAYEHPTIPFHELITNRSMNNDLVLHRFDEEFTERGKVVDLRVETLLTLTETLLSKVGKIRTAGVGGTGRDFNYLILRQLLDLVQEKGARTDNQRITADDVNPILMGKTPAFAKVLGARDWGECINVPAGTYIDRPHVKSFLRRTLPIEEIFEGVPKVALLYGISGSGKSSAASRYARSQIENLAFVLWIDSSSTESIEHDLAAALERLGMQPIGDEATPENVGQLLQEVPVPWLLVLDGVRSIEEIDDWVPRSGYGQVIITTNRADFAKDYAPSLKVDRFATPEVREFFAQRFPAAEWTEDAFTKCEDIAKRLSNWPLALEIATSWILRQGGTQDSLERFQDRIARVDLNDSVLIPHGYPKTATRVIRDVLEDLSSQGRRVLKCILLLGGRRVPKQFLIAWGEKLDVRLKDSLEELFGASVVQLEIMNVSPPHDYDELVSLHDFIILILSDNAIELDAVSVEGLVDTSERSLQTLADSGRFREGATIVRPVDSLMQCLLTNMQGNPIALVRISIVMHNLAQMAVLTSNSSLARRWYTVALNVRKGHLGDPDLVPGRVKLQLQTMAGLSSVLARDLDLQGLSVLADDAVSLVRAVSRHEILDSTTLMALKGICSNVLRSVPEAANLIEPLMELAGSSEPHLLNSSGNEKIARLQNGMDTALQMIERGQWQLGLDRSFIAVNAAIEDGLLIDWMVDNLLEAGCLLSIEIVRRPYEWPTELFELLRRLVSWFDENPVGFSEAQELQISILTSISVGDSLTICDAIRNLPSEDEQSSNIRDWVNVAIGVSSQYERLRAHNLFRQLPDGVTVDVALDGGDDINVWQVIDSRSERAFLWVCTAGRVRYDERGRSDPVKAAFVEAGLPAPVLAGPLEVAEGWSANLQGKSLTVVDSAQVERVMVDGLDAQFCDNAIERGGFVLVYGDMSLGNGDDSPPPQGWVYLSTASLKLVDEQPATSMDGLTDRGWLKGLREWLRKYF